MAKDRGGDLKLLRFARDVSAVGARLPTADPRPTATRSSRRKVPRPTYEAARDIARVILGCRASDCRSLREGRRATLPASSSGGCAFSALQRRCPRFPKFANSQPSRAKGKLCPLAPTAA